MARRAGGVWQELAVIGLLGFTIWVRIGGIDLGWFMLDQARDAGEALKIVHGQELPVAGPVASGLSVLGPLYYYLIAIPFALSSDPTVSVAFLLVLNVAAIYLTYRLGKEVFSSLAGLIAAALYSVFPMAAISGMALWNPGFIPFFSILFMYSLCRYIIAQQPWWLVATLGSLAALLQIHLTGCIFAILLLVALVLFRPPLSPKALTCAVLLCLALYAPYLSFEWQRGFQDLRDMVSFAQDNWTAVQAQSTAVVVWRALAAPFLLPEQFGSALGHDVGQPLFAVIQRGELVLFGLSLVYLLCELIRQPERRVFVLLGLWLVLPLGLFSRKRIALLWYYFDVLYPVQFLLIGLLLSAPTSWKRLGNNEKIRTCLIGGAVLLVIAVFASQAWFLKRYQSAVGQEGVLRFPTTISLGSPDPWGPFTRQDTHEVLETMPMRFKKALTEQLLSAFHVEQTAYERNVHGLPVFSLREDKGYFFTWLSKRHSERLADPRRDYVILRDDLHSHIVEWGERARVGPFRIVGYQSWIRDGSWKYHLTTVQDWYSPGFDDAAWEKVSMPARVRPNLSVYADVPLYAWGGPNVYLRGWIDVPGGEHRFHLVLGFRDDFAFPDHVAAIHINGIEVPATRAITYNTVVARHSEVSFDLTGFLKPGANLVAFQIVDAEGGVVPPTDPLGQLMRTRAFELDIYEFHQ